MPTYLWLALVATATALGLCLLGYWPTVKLAGTTGVAAMLVGVGVALLGSWAGALPTVLYLRKPPREHATGILAGLAVRFAVTMALTMVMWLVELVPQKPLIWWIGIAQFVILGVDVLGLTALLKRATKEGS